MLFEEHQRWKDMTWLVGYSLAFPLNFGIFKSNLVGKAGQEGSWAMGSFINLLKSGKMSSSL